jgi:hypothetical protein
MPNLTNEYSIHIFETNYENGETSPIGILNEIIKHNRDIPNTWHRFQIIKSAIFGMNGTAFKIAEKVNISEDAADYWGNPRPYNCDPLFEQLHSAINICDNPYMRILILKKETSSDFITKLIDVLSHEYFKEQHFKLTKLKLLFKKELIIVIELNG